MIHSVLLGSLQSRVEIVIQLMNLLRGCYTYYAGLWEGCPLSCSVRPYACDVVSMAGGVRGRGWMDSSQYQPSGGDLVDFKTETGVGGWITQLGNLASLLWTLNFETWDSTEGTRDLRWRPAMGVHRLKLSGLRLTVRMSGECYPLGVLPNPNPCQSLKPGLLFR